MCRQSSTPARSAAAKTKPDEEANHNENHRRKPQQKIRNAVRSKNSASSMRSRHPRTRSSGRRATLSAKNSESGSARFVSRSPRSPMPSVALRSRTHRARAGHGGCDELRQWLTEQGHGKRGNPVRTFTIAALSHGDIFYHPLDRLPLISPLPLELGSQRPATDTVEASARARRGAATDFSNDGAAAGDRAAATSFRRRSWCRRWMMRSSLVPSSPLADARGRRRLLLVEAPPHL